MQWFYAKAGQRAGPMNDADFERLVREGVVGPQTLVWHEGMADWQPYLSVAPNAVFPTAPEGVICVECGKIVPGEDAIQMGDATVCAACKPIHLQKMREGAVPAPPPAFHYAGFWIRVPAALIDGILMLALSVGIDMSSGLTLRQSLGFDDSPWGTREWILLAVESMLDLIYHVVFVAHFGGTLGKLALGLRVVRADGRRLGYLHSLARALAQYISALPCGLGFVLAAFDSQKRALHDLICNTRVIRTKP